MYQLIKTNHSMKKLLLSMALFVATIAVAETRVETFEPTDVDAQNNKTYNTTPYTFAYQQASWTTLYGGVCKKQGNMGADNYVAVVRCAKSSEEGFGYIESDSISGGIDSLSFVWNSNGDANCDLDIRIYINNDSIGGIYHIDDYKQEPPFYTFSVGNLRRAGNFVIRFVNRTPYDGTKNKNRLVIDDLTWTTYAAVPSAVENIDATPAPVDVYTLDGRCIRRAVPAGEAVNGLQNGIYLIGNRKVVVAN